MLGADQPVILHMLEIPQAKQALDGIVMELEDCSYPLLQGIVPSVDPTEAFTNVDVVLFVGAFPRKDGMERKDLIGKNASIFSEQGKILDKVASKNVKVVVVGNPANTNCLIVMKHAPSIPKENFTALTRLDHNRAKSQVALKAKVGVDQVKNTIIWYPTSLPSYSSSPVDLAKSSLDSFPVASLLSLAGVTTLARSSLTSSTLRLVANPPPRSSTMTLGLRYADSRFSSSLMDDSSEILF